MIVAQSGHSKPIFLIGYMASGKTTLGEALAASTGRRFVDLDRYIEQSSGKTVSRIFAEHGEHSFRDMETKALAALAGDCDDGLIIACGGGTPCFGDNMDIMNAAGVTVWLVAPTEVIIRRLLLDRANRPLVAGFDDENKLRDFVDTALEARTSFYCRATHRFDSSFLESEQQITQSVNRFVEQIINRY